MITETKEFRKWMEERSANDSPSQKIVAEAYMELAAEKAEQLLDRDRYAMEFAEWKEIRYVSYLGDWTRWVPIGQEDLFEPDTFSTSELLEIFKQR